MEATVTGRIYRTDSANAAIGAPVHTFWKGRVALHALLRVLGIGEGHTVLVPGFTGFSVPSAAKFTGATPVYVDIEPESFNLSVNTIQAACRLQQPSAIRTVVVQHTFGIPADIEPIITWARERGIAVIEDCAHVWGSRYRDSQGKWHEVGSLGDAAFYSSQWTKPVSTGIGGWATTTDPKLDAALCDFRQRECVPPSIHEVLLLAGQVGARSITSSSRLYWIALTLYHNLYARGLLVVGSSSPEELKGVRPDGYTKSMSRFQEWLLKRRLARTALQERRRQLKDFYDAELTASGLPVLRVPDCADPVLMRYPFRVRDKALALAQARRHWIELGDWYKNPVQASTDSEVELFGYRWGTCPEAERASKQVVNLPMHAKVTERTARRVVKLLTEVA